MAWARISRPLAEMKPRYDAVVVGSGYGGAIAASRLSRAGRSVCLLERGREFLPGEFPATLLEGTGEIQANTAAGHVGSALGLFELHANPEMNAIVGCGLGGTSLINANVSLPPDERLWDPATGHWPAALLADRQTRLEDGFRRARAMLRPMPYPADAPRLPKLDAFEESARALGASDRFSRPPITVAFADGPNAAGVAQRACIGCGDCVTGCNHGAKTTTLMTYLPDAAGHGAEIFTCAEVRSIERHPSGAWIVHFRERGVGREVFDAPEAFVTADVVVLGAGAIGSSQLLLRSKERGLPLSDRVGESFTGNGDVLAFAYDTDRVINGVGFGTHPAGEIPPVGPCITGLIDRRDTPDLQDGFVIEEGSIPGVLAPVIPEMLAVAAALVGKPAGFGIENWMREAGRTEESLVHGAYAGAMHNTQTYLVMAHDNDRGRVTLQDDRPRIAWPDAGRQAIFERIDKALQVASAPLGGIEVRDPIWTKLLNDALVTVHPLGGCAMAERAEDGVVDHAGRVFAGAAGDTVHDGLWVVDGSVMPTSLGVNPLLTISALAERSMAILAEQRGWVIDYDTPGRPISVPTQIGLRFTEKMTGWLSTDPSITDFDAAEAAGKAAGRALAFTLTVAAESLDRLLTDASHPAAIFGTVTCPALSPEPLTISDGRFSLFALDPQRAGMRDMTYSMVLSATDGRRFHFHGVKLVGDAAATAAWHQTTTLYVTLREDGSESGTVIGRGVLHIALADFMRQLGTLTVTGAPDLKARLAATARFVEAFAGILASTYCGSLAGPTYFDPDATPRQKRPLRTPPPEVQGLVAGDGTPIRLTRYQGGARGPVLLIHGAAMSSQIYRTDLVGTNLVEYLVAHGYDCWLLDHRGSPELGRSSGPARTTLDAIATFDIPAALSALRARAGVTSVQAVAHGAGGAALSMALLGDRVPAGASGVRAAVISQLATHLKVRFLSRVKAGLHMPEMLEALGVRSLSEYAERPRQWTDRIVDDALMLFPLHHAEGCRSAACHRMAVVLGDLFEHANLTPLQHERINEIFGATDVGLLEHLARIVRQGHVVAADGRDIYLPHLERMALPLLLLHGAANRAVEAESTELACDALARRNGKALYERVIVPGHGDIDCLIGREAASSVFPAILRHLDRNS